MKNAVPERLGNSILLPLLAGAVLVLAVWSAGLFEQKAPTVALPDMAGPVVLQHGNVLFVQKHEVTVAEWNRCYKARACELELKARPGMHPAQTPATGLNFNDVMQYVRWINTVSDRRFRLPRHAEWLELAAEVLPEKANPLFSDPSLTWASTYLVENLPPRALKATGSFPPTSKGIHDLSGSVWEWTQDCHTESPAERCPAFLAGGEHTAAIPYLVRDPARGGCAVGAPPAHLGFRLVSDAPA